MPKFTCDSFASRVFQDETEQYLADLVPCRDEVILANASMQRSFISLSARMFNYEAYPTFYGSPRVWDVRLKSILPIPTQINDWREEQCLRLASTVDDFSENNPDLKTIFCLVGSMEYAPSNPLRNLVSYSDRSAKMVENLLSSIRNEVSVVDLEIKTESDYVEKYFKTDHHWNIVGAYDGYAAVMFAINPDDEPIRFTGVHAWDVPFYGAYARIGLMQPVESDIIEDIEYQPSNVSVSINGKPSAFEDVWHRELYASNQWSSSVFKNRYGEYFHSDAPCGFIHFLNEDIDEDTSLLVVGGSYTNIIERLFAEHFRNVYCVDLRHYKGTVQGIVDENDVDVVLFMECLNSYLDDSFITKVL